jgi:rRNA biogenesis protein RRP5
VKKFSKDPKVWENYAHFLHTVYGRPDDARLLLPRALQILPTHTLQLTVKFAAMEFKSKNGSPERGRTMFEGILSEFPKRLDIWNQLIDLEVGQNDHEIIRAAFDRALKTKGLKDKSAKALLGRWAKWEDEHGDKKSQENIEAKKEQREMVEKLRKAGAEK